MGQFLCGFEDDHWPRPDCGQCPFEAIICPYSAQRRTDKPESPAARNKLGIIREPIAARRPHPEDFNIVPPGQSACRLDKQQDMALPLETLCINEITDTVPTSLGILEPEPAV
jgi:hypothetical protein